MTNVDLFGRIDIPKRPVVHRSAKFSGGDRIDLGRAWAPGPRAYVIGHNPSEAREDRDDPTTLWWIDWFVRFGFGSFSAGNLYPFVTPDPRACRQIIADIDAGRNWAARDALHFTNLPAVVAAAKAADKVFVCWGGIAVGHDWIEHVVEEIQSGVAPYPDLWCWGTTNSGAPKHPMARGHHRIPRDQAPILWRKGGHHGPAA